MSKFYYEHIGHMQCCEITLVLYKYFNILSHGNFGVPIRTKDLVKSVCSEGFNEKIVLSELDRFFYGGTAQDLHNGFCIFTYIGLDYYTQLINESRDQKNIIALLVRESKLKNRYNITLQETTFFNPVAYQIIDKFSLRSGGARDFIKSINLKTLDDLIVDLSQVLDNRSYVVNTIDDLISLVKHYGKYWASVGGKYSWIIFTQRYYVDVEFDKYKKLIQEMIRPVEWGGHSKDLTYNEILDILETDEEINKFINNIIIRKLMNGNYRLTCPGYLMYERISKGKIFEFEVRKKQESNLYELIACNASDCCHQDLYDKHANVHDTLMRLRYVGSLNEIIEIVNKSILGRTLI